MRAARIRLIVATILLIGWLGYLGYLVLFERHPVVVSRSQVMASTHFILAHVSVGPDGLPNPAVTVVQDLRPLGTPLSGTIKVRNIKEGRIAGEKGFQENVSYLLMLTRTEDGFDLTPPPRAPGHETMMRPRPWAYRWDAEGVQRQFEELVPNR
jgi:hypothetical protein